MLSAAKEAPNVSVGEDERVLKRRKGWGESKTGSPKGDDDHYYQKRGKRTILGEKGKRIADLSFPGGGLMGEKRAQARDSGWVMGGGIVSAVPAGRRNCLERRNPWQSGRRRGHRKEGCSGAKVEYGRRGGSFICTWN